MLSDPNLVLDLSNLDMKPHNPFGKYAFEVDYLTMMNSGAWSYQKAYSNLIKDPTKDFLLPICFACDEDKLMKIGKEDTGPCYFRTPYYSTKSFTPCPQLGGHLVIFTI